MKRNYIIILSTVALLIFGYGCKKEDYQGDAVFWYGKNTSEKLIENGISNLTFYLDNEIIGSTAANVYWVEKPYCGDNASISTTKELGSVKTQAYSYEIKSDNGNVIWEGIININADGCSSVELVWDNNNKKAVATHCNCTLNK